MKIAIFHLGFFYSGGGEKLILEEIKGLKAIGHDVTCYAPYIDVEGCFPDVEEMKEIEALLPPPPSWLPMKDPIWVLMSCLLIPLQARKFAEYDVFFGANQPGPWFAYVLSKMLEKPYVIYLAQALRLLHPREVDLGNGIRIREGDHRFLMALRRLGGHIVNWADRASTREANVVLTNGDYVNRWIHKVYGVASTTCPAGCHPISEADLNYEFRWHGSLSIGGTRIQKPFVLLTNRHSPMKRFEYVLWALKAIRTEVPELTLVITGQPTEYTEQLVYLVDGLRLNSNVKFLGLVPENDLSTLYKEAALYVYPSPEEDFGMGIVEAMAAGTPVVAWNNGGPAGIVSHRSTGLLAEPEDIDSFAESILLLITNPTLSEQMGRAAHSRAQKLFSYQRHVRIIESALVDAVEANSQDYQSRSVGQPMPYLPESVSAISVEDTESNA